MNLKYLAISKFPYKYFITQYNVEEIKSQYKAEAMYLFIS